MDDADVKNVTSIVGFGTHSFVIEIHNKNASCSSSSMLARLTYRTDGYPACVRNKQIPGWPLPSSPYMLLEKCTTSGLFTWRKCWRQRADGSCAQVLSSCILHEDTSMSRFPLRWSSVFSSPCICPAVTITLELRSFPHSAYAPQCDPPTSTAAGACTPAGSMGIKIVGSCPTGAQTAWRSCFKNCAFRHIAPTCSLVAEAFAVGGCGAGCQTVAWRKARLDEFCPLGVRNSTLRVENALRFYNRIYFKSC